MYLREDYEVPSTQTNTILCSIQNFYKCFNMLNIPTIDLFNLQTENFVLPPNTPLFTIEVKSSPTETYFGMKVDKKIFLTIMTL